MVIWVFQLRTLVVPVVPVLAGYRVCGLCNHRTLDGIEKATRMDNRLTLALPVVTSAYGGTPVLYG